MEMHTYIYTEFTSCIIYPFKILIRIGIVLFKNPKKSIVLFKNCIRKKLNSFHLLKKIQFAF